MAPNGDIDWPLPEKSRAFEVGQSGSHRNRCLTGTIRQESHKATPEIARLPKGRDDFEPVSVHKLVDALAGRAAVIAYLLSPISD
jgi:hypothetical protein